MTDWVCTGCGESDRATPQPLTSIDARYTLGYCDRCAPEFVGGKKRKAARPVLPLIRAAYFDRDKWQEKLDRDELAGIVHELAGGRGKVQLTDRQTLRLVELFDRFGFAGFFLPEDHRDAATKIKLAEANRKQDSAKGRKAHSRRVGA